MDFRESGQRFELVDERIEMGLREGQPYYAIINGSPCFLVDRTGTPKIRPMLREDVASFDSILASGRGRITPRLPTWVSSTTEFASIGNGRLGLHASATAAKGR